MNDLVSIKVENGQLTLVVKADPNPEASSTGKSDMLYTTHGFIPLEDGSRLSVNWCRKKAKA